MIETYIFVFKDLGRLRILKLISLIYNYLYRSITISIAQKSYISIYYFIYYPNL